MSNAPSVYDGRAPPSFPMHLENSDAVLHPPAVLLGEQHTEEDDEG